MKKIMMIVMASMLLIVATSRAHAVVLLPGDLNIAPTGAASPGGTFLTSVVAPFTGTDINGTVYYTGTLTETVRQNSTGTLFEYSFNNNIGSIEAITQLATQDYSRFSVDADALAVAGSATGTPSVNGMNRSNGGNGSFITYGWLNNPVNPGQNSGSFWIQTNAPSYEAGTTQLIGGGIATVRSFGPSAAVPEPATMSLLGMGFLGLLRFRRKNTV